MLQEISAKIRAAAYIVDKTRSCPRSRLTVKGSTSIRIGWESQTYVRSFAEYVTLMLQTAPPQRVPARQEKDVMSTLSSYSSNSSYSETATIEATQT